MGQKVNPHGLRVGIIKDWDSKWYAEADFADNLVEDYKIRTYLKKRLYTSGVSQIEIERASDRVKITIFTSKPGVVIGKGGSEIEKVKKELKQFTEKKLVVDIKEVKRPDRDAQLVAENIAQSLENRVSFRRAMKQSIGRTMRLGAKGIKVKVSGRLAGAEIARSESYHEGTIPLQTIRADIDYGFAEADTTYGKLGVKVWIYKGEVLKGDAAKAAAQREKSEKKNDRRNNNNRRDDRRDGNRRGGNRNFNRDNRRSEGGNQ
jgi:small subunit ribosomal protein S3